MILPLGQGKPLPLDFPYKGQWLIENLLFLYTGFDAQGLAGGSPRFTAAAPGIDGKVSIGFDAAQIAAALNISTDAVLAANSKGTLSIVGIEDAVSPRGVAGKRYIFSMGGRQCALIIDKNHDAGAA